MVTWIRLRIWVEGHYLDELEKLCDTETKAKDRDVRAAERLRGDDFPAKLRLANEKKLPSCQEYQDYISFLTG
eukprot:TRINITY_DN5356_c0_g1_i1.p2 TRINITY_DN5356_c0_g1~~TRINITY_DN5356_c0_g1_i1.p2  ORF type:complete len:73 (-),score=3.35 TRINITY_DN5356_c0_g1_i1:103-321(-)